MLEGLDNIRWRQLRDAYGPSLDTPGCIRALASDSPRRRASALKTLWGTIWHQGTVYDATVEAVPFLIELLREPSVAGKADVLELLTAIAEGRGYWEVHKDLILNRERAKTPEVREEMRAEEQRLARIAQRIDEGLADYLQLLKHADEAVRQNAIQLLRRLSRHADAIVPELDRVVRDGSVDARVRAAAFVARFSIDGRDDGVMDAAHGDDVPPVLRAVAAWADVRLRGPEARGASIEACKRLAAYEDAPAGEPLAVLGAWETAAITALSLSGVPTDEDTLVRLADAFLSRGERSEIRAAALLSLALPPGPAPQQSDRLTPAQRRCVEAVCALAFPRPDEVWINFSEVLQRRGLPETRKAMESYLGTPLPVGILDNKPDDGKQPWWRFW